jgi:hypothetical protein
LRDRLFSFGFSLVRGRGVSDGSLGAGRVLDRDREQALVIQQGVDNRRFEEKPLRICGGIPDGGDMCWTATSL